MGTIIDIVFLFSVAALICLIIISVSSNWGNDEACQEYPDRDDPEEDQEEANIDQALDDIRLELAKAQKWKEWDSAHEGFAILLEEVDELKAEVWVNQTKRSVKKLRKEAIQVAAMALRFVTDVCDKKKHRV